MIMGFVGKMGSGKTLSMTRELLKYKQKGYTVYTNYGVSFSDGKIDFNKLFEMAKNQEKLGHVVLGLDEIHILLDSRSSITNKNKVMTFWLNQTRKLDVKLLYTTQYLHQVDKRLRSGTNLVIMCDGMTVVKRGEEYFVCHNEYLGRDDELKEDTFIGNDYFKYFDTSEVIDFDVGGEDAKGI